MPLLPHLRPALILAAVLACATTPVAAQVYQLDFTGVITDSRDRGPSSLFGGADLGGQIGVAIAGSILIDTAGYGDQNAQPYYGTYGPTNGLFPQPLNYFVSSYTILSRTFQGSQYMGPATQHSLESAYVQDIPPLNDVQQDIFQISDGSQRLVCSNPANPQTCSGGESAVNQLTIRLYGIYDFVSSDALAQSFNLNAATIADIVAAPGGGQGSSYLMRNDGNDAAGRAYWAEGSFVLSSLRLAPAQAVPEPGTLPLMLLGVASWCLRRRLAGPR